LLSSRVRAEPLRQPAPIAVQQRNRNHGIAFSA
jgi:hypothetical protein